MNGIVLRRAAHSTFGFQDARLSSAASAAVPTEDGAAGLSVRVGACPVNETNPLNALNATTEIRKNVSQSRCVLPKFIPSPREIRLGPYCYERGDRHREWSD